MDSSGPSGLKVSEITYGNWLTHGSQVGNDAAQRLRRRPSTSGITTFDTADVYAEPPPRPCSGKALQAQRRESLEIFTKVYWPDRPEGPNDTGLSRKHIMERSTVAAPLGTDYVDLYQAHRYDHETPLEETMQAFADVVRSGQGAVHRRLASGRPSRCARVTRWPGELRIPLVSNQPQYSMLWRVIEAEVVPASEELGMSPGRLVARWRRASSPASTCPASPRRPGSGPPTRRAARNVDLPVHGRRLLERVQKLRPIADELGLTMSQLAIAWVLQNPNVATAMVGASRPEQVAENVKAVGRGDPAGADDRHRRCTWRLGRARPGHDREPGEAPGVGAERIPPKWCCRAPATTSDCSPGRCVTCAEHDPS